jgi:hypothetical protein
MAFLIWYQKDVPITAKILKFISHFMPLIKVKVKVHPRSDHGGPEGEQRYSSTLSVTLTL